MEPIPMEPDSEGASESYQPGSDEDFDRLYRSAYPRVFRTLAAILGDPADAEDCVQEAFVRAYKAWSRWSPDAPAEAWVHRIAVNTAISHHRRARLRSVGEVLRRLGRPGNGPDPAEVATQPDILAALRSIPPKLAVAIVLRHYHGYSNREIAAALGISERTVGSRLRLAGERLRRVLGEEWNPGFSLGPSRALSSRSERGSYVDR
jgi:RNA polymerase sigma-70 factor, ECF subfamily